MPSDLVTEGKTTNYYTRKSLRVGRPWVAAALASLAFAFWRIAPPGPEKATALVPLFIVLAVYLIYRLPDLLRPSPRLALDPEGFTDRTTWAGLGRLRWNDVASLSVFVRGRIKGVAVTPGDPEAFRSSLPWTLRFALPLNRLWGFPEFFIPTLSLSEEPEEVVMRMQTYRAEAQP